MQFAMEVEEEALLAGIAVSVLLIGKGVEFRGWSFLIQEGGWIQFSKIAKIFEDPPKILKILGGGRGSEKFSYFGKLDPAPPLLD